MDIVRALQTEPSLEPEVLSRWEGAIEGVYRHASRFCGSPVPEGVTGLDRCFRIKCSRAQESQREAYEFIVRRFSKSGGQLPVLSKEIIEHTSLRSASNVHQVLRELVFDGKLLVVSRQGKKGCAPIGQTAIYKPPTP